MVTEDKVLVLEHHILVLVPLVCVLISVPGDKYLLQHSLTNSITFRTIHSTNGIKNTNG